MTLDTLKIKYRRHNLSQIDYALGDIKETLAIWRDSDTEYTRQLWSEWDYLIVLKQKMLDKTG